MTNLQRRLAKIETRLAPANPEVVQIRIVASATGQLIGRARFTSYGPHGPFEEICEGPFFEKDLRKNQ